MEKKICAYCDKLFTKPSWAKPYEWRDKIKYCSKECSRKNFRDRGKKNLFKKGHEAWNKGKTGWVSEEGKRAMSDNAKANLAKETPEQKTARYKKIVASRNKNDSWNLKGKPGKEHPSWLDDKASYNAKHRWIQKHWIKSGVCQDCGAKPEPFGRRKYGTEWANLDGSYDRNSQEFWKELCVSCHRALDRVK